MIDLPGLTRSANGRLLAVQICTVQLARAVRRFSLAGESEAPSLGAWQRRMQQETGRCVGGWRTGGCAGRAMLRTRVVYWRGKCAGGLGVCLVERAAGITFSPGL